jgi:hypothetical protein
MPESLIKEINTFWDYPHSEPQTASHRSVFLNKRTAPAHTVFRQVSISLNGSEKTIPDLPWPAAMK